MVASLRTAVVVVLATAAELAVALHGRFLHLTDMHPDPHYVAGSSVAAACHANQPKGGRRAGYWGTPASECDAPMTLINSTFDWLEKNLKDEVDFVIWTGDNARHDIDSELPRTRDEILKLNEMIASRMDEIFGHIPIVTSIGNNDVYPHNIMFPGPSQAINKFSEIWDTFIPEDQFHTFARGGYYSRSALPDLMLISLNTLYMFDNNKAVDGCPLPGRSSKGAIQPGSEQLQWLEQQLILARIRGMQVILTGHVPAVENSWYPDCYERYTELILRFHDTVLGQMFGHANFDYFTFLHAEKGRPKSRGPNPLTFADNLYDQYKQLKKVKDDPADFAVVNVNPSVIPTFQPTLRVWQYNVTSGDGWRQRTDEALEAADNDDHSWLRKWLPWSAQRPFLRETLAFDDTDALSRRKKHKKKRKKKRPQPLPRHFDPKSPSMRNSRLSMLGYTQFYLPLQEHERRLAEEGQSAADLKPDWKIEYTSFTTDSLAQSLASNGTAAEQPPAIPHHLWPTELVESTSSKRDMSRIIDDLGLTPYQLRDLTLPAWLQYAQRLVKSRKAWKVYRRMMFVQTIDD